MVVFLIALQTHIYSYTLVIYRGGKREYVVGGDFPISGKMFSEGRGKSWEVRRTDRILQAVAENSVQNLCNHFHPASQSYSL